MDQNKQSASSDEIDITQFFRWVGSGFARFGNSILQSMARLRALFLSHRTYFSIVIAGGLITGGVYSGLLEKKYYTSSMIISCDYLNMRIIENSIEKLNLLAKFACNNQYNILLDSSLSYQVQCLRILL